MTSEPGPDQLSPGPSSPGESVANPLAGAAQPAKLPQRDLFPLPALLAICLYLVMLAGVIVLGVVGRHYPPLFLILSAAFLTAAAGLIMLFRWAWAAALAAVFLLACYNAWIFASLHNAPSLVQGGLNLVFFLYLVRAEVRDRLR
jgi:hypothetical protein